MRHEQKIQRFRLPASALSVSQLMRSCGSPVVLPFWHMVSDSMPEHVTALYSPPDVKQFKKELDFLLKHFIPIGIEELVHKSLVRGRQYMHLSFDDGLVEMYQIVAPILKEKGIPASFFINPPFVNDEKYLFRYQVSYLVNQLENLETLSVIEKQNWYEILMGLTEKDDALIAELESILPDAPLVFPPQRIYMNQDEIQSLYYDGFHIGAHSMSHTNFELLSLADQFDEVSDSVNYINNKWPSDVRSFAFPYSDDGVTEDGLRQIHVNADLNVSFGTSGVGKHPEIPHFQRIPMEYSRRYQVINVIKSQLFVAALKQKIRK